jgi:hypothetical protein
MITEILYWRNPEAMFKKLVLNYGEAYMTETNSYWKSIKARKEGYKPQMVCQETL